MKLKKTAGVFGLASLLVAGTLLPTTASAAEGLATKTVRINFDTGTAPCSSRATSPLREEYAKFGIHFGDGGKGGKVLNECARIGLVDNLYVHAHSHRQYLALNESKAGVGYQQITVDKLRRHAEIWASTGDGYDGAPTDGAVQWDLFAYRNGQEVGDGIFLYASPSWAHLQVDVPAGYDTLQVECYNCLGSWVMDDLTISG